jgi:hypothetical protein
MRTSLFLSFSPYHSSWLKVDLQVCSVEVCNYKITTSGISVDLITDQEFGRRKR